MKYVDKDGNEILAGMTLRFPDGSTEEVYETEDQYGNPNLGINASNEDFLKYHGTDREYYSLSNFSAADMEIIPEKEKVITVLVVEPMKRPDVRQIDNTLESMQKNVGGLIQPIYPFDDPVALVCNDEGKLMGLPPNRLLRDDSGQPYDLICGTFFITGLGTEDFTSLTDEQIGKYTKLFEKEMLMPAPQKKKHKNVER